MASVDKMTLFLVGGTTRLKVGDFNKGEQDGIYMMECLNRQCHWSKLLMALAEAKHNMVVGVIPDELIACESKNDVIPNLDVYDYIDYYDYYDYLIYNNLTSDNDNFDYDYLSLMDISETTINKNILRAWYEEAEVFNKVIEDFWIGNSQIDQ